VTRDELDTLVRDLRAANADLVTTIVTQANAAVRAAEAHRDVVTSLARALGHLDNAVTALTPLEPPR
jgi:hypothetical protein